LDIIIYRLKNKERKMLSRLIRKGFKPRLVRNSVIRRKFSILKNNKSKRQKGKRDQHYKVCGGRVNEIHISPYKVGFGVVGTTIFVGNIYILKIRERGFIIGMTDIFIVVHY